jgi:hypothetical protein
MTDNVPHQEFPVLSCPFVQILYAHDLLNVGSGQQLSCISDTDSAYGVFLYRILWMQTSPQVQMELLEDSTCLHHNGPLLQTQC